MFDTFSMTNTILYSFIQRRKSASKPFQELIQKFARDLVPPFVRDLVPARQRREKDDKTAVRKAVISDAVGAQLFQQQAFSQWDDFNEFVGIYIISFQQTQIQDLAN